MFWKKVEGLSQLPISSKLAITLFLCVAGIGYILGFFNIYLSYNGVDGKPGLSVADIRMSFHGSGSGTKLSRAIDGSMKGNFAGDADYNTVKAWLGTGAKEADFGPIKEIFAKSCIACHSTDAKTGGIALETYTEVSTVLGSDSGKSIQQLVSISHLHVMGILSLVFLLCLVFSFTAFSEPVKIVVMAFSLCSIVADIGSWWLAKLFGAMAPLVILGGVCLAITFLALILLPLYDLWLRKARA